MSRSSFCMSCWLIVTLVLASASFAAEEAGEELVAMVIELLGDKDKDVRAVGLDQVRAEAKGQNATRQFAAQLRKLPPDAQVGLMSALADRGDAAARPAVVNVLATSRDEAVRIAAIEAVGLLGEPTDLRPLVQLLSTGSKAEIAASRNSLVRLRGEDVPAGIVAEMKQAPLNIRVALIEILTARRALDTIPDLLSIALDDDPVVRTAAMTALGQLASSEHISGMVQAVLKAEKGAEREAAEKAVMLVCSRIEDPEQRAEPLLAAMETLGEAGQTALLSTLGRVGGSAALKIIEASIADADSQRHNTGLHALCNWPNAMIAPRLIELAKTEPHPEHREMALAALIRVAPLPDKRPAVQKLELLQMAMSMCTRDEDRKLVLKRARAIRTVDTLRFVMPYLEQPAFAEQACETVVELAHHRDLREPNKAEFHRALDKVIATSKDATVVERATRYKKNQTWARPTKPAQP